MNLGEDQRIYNWISFWQVLKTVISKGLSKTREQQLSSIAFPPLGIKDLHLPSNEVAEIMVEEIMHFAEEQTGKKLDVYIVISLDNTDVYEVSYWIFLARGLRKAYGIISQYYPWDSSYSPCTIMSETIKR